MNTKAKRVENAGMSTLPVQALLRSRIAREPEFAGLLLQGAVENLLQNNVVTAQLLLRDITNCTIGFQTLADATGILEKSLMRMLSARGNPQARNLFSIIHALQQLNEVNLAITASPGTRLRR